MNTLAIMFVLCLSTVSYAQGTKELEVLFQNLRSDHFETRIYARENLGKAGPAVIPDMMRELALDDSNYRIRLGIILGLNEMVYPHAAPRAQISAQLTRDDIARLVSYVADEDRTIRDFSVQFLRWLKDPRIAQPAIKLAAQFNGESQRIRQIQGTLVFLAGNSFFKKKRPEPIQK